jgi:hypothetical protein
LDFSADSRNVAKDLSALSFQTNQFEDDLSDKVDNEFTSKSDSSRNPFLAQTESPKKPSKMFQKPTDMMIGSKNNKYDVFKNEMVDGPKLIQASPQTNTKSKTDANPDLFKDFAIAAFGEFKIDKTSSMIHEFSNKLSDQKSLLNGNQKKVINVCVL